MCVDHGDKVVGDIFVFVFIGVQGQGLRVIDERNVKHITVTVLLVLLVFINGRSGLAFLNLFLFFLWFFGGDRDDWDQEVEARSGGRR